MSAGSSGEVTALILAGGLGSRLGAGVPKPLIEVRAGRTVLDLVLQSYQSFSGVGHIVVVAVPAFRDRIGQIARQYGKVDAVVAGGETRQSSVQSGLTRVNTPIVILHEAARPFVQEDTVNSCLRCLRSGSAAVFTTFPTSDSIVRVQNDVITEVHPRGTMSWVQSPLAFNTGILRDCYQRARAEGETDIPGESTLFSRYGIAPLRTVRGTSQAFKLTHPADLARLRSCSAGIQDNSG